MSGETPAAGASPDPEPATGSGARPSPGVVAEFASFLEALVRYIFDLLRLEGHRLETEGRSLLRRLWLVLAAAALALLGALLVSLGLAFWIAAALGSQAAGFAIVGALYVLIGAAGAALAGRRRPNPDRSGGLTDDARPH